jgi:bacterioferritin (cytochrome b1)
MVEITIDVPKDIKDVVAETGKAIYVEALKEVAARRIAYIQQQLEDLREKMRFYELKYSKTYEAFLESIPDTVEGHDDWIEWTYLTKAAEELSYKIQKLRLLTGK